MENEGFTEAALLDQIRSKNTEAFHRLIDTYQNRVFGFVRRMVVSREEAEDITQEVFLKAFVAMDQFDGRASMRSWLFRIAHNLCIDAARKKSRSTIELNPLEDFDPETLAVDATWNPEDILMREELSATVEKAIESMSEKLRSVLFLHDREGMSYEELAAVLEIPVGTAKSRLFLARSAIQVSVEKYLEGGIS